MKWGLLIIGVFGASASTISATLLGEEYNVAEFRRGSYWCSLVGDFPSEVYDLAVGGWDYRFGSLAEAIRANGLYEERNDAYLARGFKVFPAVIGPSDYAVRVDHMQPTHSSCISAIEDLRANIRTFREENSLDRVIIANLSSPMYCGEDAETGWSSATAYAMASVEEGADWVEFTPSDTITPDLCECAKRTGSRIAGRDGSTGQTILKLLLRDFLDDRALEVLSWYSTNLIGNRDGLVLSHKDYNRTKLRDKTKVIPNDPMSYERHLVDIRFVPTAGDNKEAWDCVFFRGWMNKVMSLRIDWHGADSFLAAPLLLDIVSGLMHAERTGHPRGIVPQLGLFFKAPAGMEEYRYSELHANLKAFIGTQGGERS